MTDDIVWVELCCGAAATTLRLIGGPHLQPVVSYMGGKRRQASDILAAMGLEPRQRIRQVVLADAGPWGWVWPVLLDPELSGQVAEVLEGWADKDARELWADLASKDPAVDLTERTAGWLWLQARSASGVPLWWDGNQYAQADHATGRTTRAGQTGSPGWRMGSARPSVDEAATQRGIWKASDGRGSQRVAGQRGELGCGGIMHPETVAARARAAAETVATWLVLQAGTYIGKPVTVQEGRWATHGFSRPSVAAQSLSGSCFSIERIIERLPGDIEPGWAVFHGDVNDMEPIPGAYVYMDPDYVGKTGYGWTVGGHDQVEAVARRWSDAGCVVAVSEAVPLPFDGWHHVDLSTLGRKGAGPEWLTMNRPPARVPGSQMALFAAG
jgi:hypothetical protein